MITQEQVKTYLIDVIGYDEEDIADFNDETSVFHGRLQYVLSEKQLDDLIKYYEKI